MNLRTTPWRAAGGVIVACALLCACNRDPTPATTAAKDNPARDGRPAAGGAAPASGDRQVWQPPQVTLDGTHDGNSSDKSTLDKATLAATRRRAATALAQGRLYEDADSAIPILLALLQHDPNDTQAQAALDRALLQLAQAGDEALAAAGDDAAALQRARTIAGVMRGIGIERFETGDDYLARVNRAETLWALNDAGERALARHPPQDAYRDALALFRKALALEPGQPRAMQGVAAVESTMLRQAEDAAVRGDFVQAENWLDLARKVRPGSATVEVGRQHVENVRRIRIALLRDEGLALLAEPARRNHLQWARQRLAQMLHISTPGEPAATELRTRIDLATHYGLMRPGQRFTDALTAGGRGPEMVVVPHGGFRMGARDGEPDASDAERPARYVRFERGFAIARTEITVGEFRRFVEASGHRARAVRRGHSLIYADRAGNFVRSSGVDWRHDYLGHPAADDMPVSHVSAKDAEAYAHWLSERTGQHYRLPSEAEFEYALRAGETGHYPWGDKPPTAGTGNLTGGGDRSPGGRQWGNAFAAYRDGYWGPAPVARFRANGFGIHDLEGNVSEWVADCWHDGYRRAPTQGEAWVNPGCRTRVIRGGAWANAPAQTRAAWRRQAEADSTNALTGFRIVRDL